MIKWGLGFFYFVFVINLVNFIKSVINSLKLV